MSGVKEHPVALPADTGGNGRQAAPPASTGDRERFLTLDVLRGVAIFGMAFANILECGFPASAAAQWGAPESPPGELSVVLLLSIFVSGKFYTLFALLFGIGIALQQERSAARGAPFSSTYARRLLVLLLIGVAHTLFFYAGDILGYYALLGFVALLFLRCRQRTLLASATVLFLLPVVIPLVVQIAAPQLMPDRWLDWQGRADARLAMLEAGHATPEAIRSDQALDLYRHLADDERVFRSGTWREMALHRAGTYFLAMFPLKLLFLSGNTLAMFLLGIYLARRRVFLDAPEQRPLYKRLILAGLVFGLPLQLAALATMALDPSHPAIMLVNRLCAFSGNSALGLGYAGIVARLCLSKACRRRLRFVAAVGRMALSNYLALSILCGFVFYSYGLALFGRLSLLQAEGVALLICALQAAVSTAWLRRFRFGPVEWGWRTLTYGKVQPMLRPRG